MKRTALFGAVLAVFGPGLAFADMNYTNFQISLLDVELETGRQHQIRLHLTEHTAGGFFRP